MSSDYWNYNHLFLQRGLTRIKLSNANFVCITLRSKFDSMCNIQSKIAAGFTIGDDNENLLIARC